jgi:hypothetical protein
MSFNQELLDINCEKFYEALTLEWQNIEDISQDMGLDRPWCFACITTLDLQNRIDCLCTAVHNCDENNIVELVHNNFGKGFPRHPKTCGGCGSKLKDEDVKYTFLIRRK